MSDIENEFSRLRGRPIRLSPLDWQLVAEWESAGIPLSLILRTMTEVYKRFAESNPRGQIGSIRYFQPAITAAAADWNSRQIGKSSDASAPVEIETEELNAHLAELVAAALKCLSGLDKSQRVLLAHIEEDLRDLTDQVWTDPDLLEFELNGIDIRLVAGLKAVANLGAQQQFELAGTVSDPVLRSAQIAAAVRKHFNAPELTLFGD